MSQIGSLVSFSNGTSAQAPDVNSNFATIKSAHNDTDTSVTSLLSGNITINGNKIWAGTCTFNNNLSLLGSPASGSHATNKTYVDAQTALKLSLSGGTMTGNLILNGVPTTSLQAATKGYVDSNFLALTGGTLTGNLILNGNPSTTLQAATKGYVDSNFLALAGGTMTGTLTLNGDPASSLQAATKQYVDNFTGSTNIVTLGTIATGSIPYTLVTGKTFPSGTIVGTSDAQTLTNKTIVVTNGNTASRPGAPVTGQVYIDTQIGLPIWYNGSNWKDFAGNTV